MTDPERFPYLDVRDAHGQAWPRPLLPVTLQNGTRTIDHNGLLDTGATVSVLPYEAGLELGLTWTEHKTPVELTGNLARYDARGVILTASVGRYEPVRLIFAWTRAPNVPLILGQLNFFAEFDVCFFQARGIFELQPKQYDQKNEL